MLYSVDVVDTIYTVFTTVYRFH